MRNASPRLYYARVGSTRAITLRLDPADYERLEVEAARLGVSPGTLARVYVRASLRSGAAEVQRRRDGLAALDLLAALTSGLPPVDAVGVARAGRDELARRSPPP
jgi:hypothetical protein